MKIKSLLIGMLACTALVGCSNEDVIDNPNENPVLNGEKGYLKVKLVDTTGSGSRAEDGFQEGSPNENKVSTVDFFFFKSDGTLTHHVNENDLSWHTSTGNVEYFADATVVLKGLNQNTWPNSVIVLLNAPTDLITALSDNTVTTDATTGKETETYNVNLTDFKNKVIETWGTDGNFIMSNSTFYDSTNKLVESITNAGTVVSENDFILESSDAELSDANTVNIYVERLAAKVTVTATNTTTADGATPADGSISTASDGTVKAQIGKFNIKSIDEETGAEETTEKTLYAKIEGWKLNATTKSTRVIKEINTAWSFEDVTGTEINEAFTWNAPNYFRSYWGKSTNYGIAEGANDANNKAVKYPSSFANAVATDGSNVVTGTNVGNDADGATLNYVPFKDLKNKVNTGSEYCMENTNDVTNTSFIDKFYSAVTQVVLGATIVDESGNTVELVRYNRILYTPEAFIARVLNEVDLDIWKVDTENTTETVYKQLSSKDIEEYNVYDGKVKVRAKNTSEKWYTRTQTAGADTPNDDTDDKYSYSEYTGVSLSDRLASIFDEDVVGEYYNDGAMHYVIPIKHSRPGDGIFEEKGVTTDKVSIGEAEYGVVRNHLYQLNITKIANLGTSVYDPDEDIIKTTVDNTTYQIACQLNVLSWRIVQQGVEL